MSRPKRSRGTYSTYDAIPLDEPSDHPLFKKEKQLKIMYGEEPGSLAGSCQRNPITWATGVLSILALLGVSIWAIINSTSGEWATYGNDDDDVWVGGSKPHIIYILADDMGWNSIGYEDYDLGFATPTLTALAQSGVILDNFYAQEVCTPARASLLTGRYPLSIGMQYSMVQTAIPWGMDLKETTLANVLSGDDYSTHALGKWHLGHYTPRFLPTARGFDTFFGFLNGESYYWSKRNPDHTVFHDIIYMDQGCYAPYKDDDMHDYSTFLYRDKAKELIEQHNDTRSLFLYLAWQAVHDPFVDIGLHQSGMPIEYLDASVYAKITDKESGVVGRKRRQYAMALSVLDSAVADIISKLEEKGMLENTVIVFSSDNGGCFGSGGKNGPLRGTKGSMFEGGTKVDSFMWSPLFPSKLQGKVYSNLFHISDWFPTILGMTDTSYTPSDGYALDGFNHFPAILGESDEVPREYMLYNYYYNVETYSFNTYTNGSLAIRDSQYKLMHAFNSTTYALWYQPEVTNADDDSITEENRCSASMNNDGDFLLWLFDLENDPFEETNLYYSEDAEHVAAKERLYAQLNIHAANAYTVTNDFSANRASFQVWRDHDNWMVPYAKSSDFDESKGGTYPHDDKEDDCFADERRRLEGPRAEQDLKKAQEHAEGRRQRREAKGNTSPKQTQGVIEDIIERHTQRRLGAPLVHSPTSIKYRARRQEQQLRWRQRQQQQSPQHHHQQQHLAP